MKFSRRNWKREAVAFVRYPLRMFEGKTGKPSQFRIILFAFSVTFVAHWPPYPWGVWEWAALAVLALALPVADLFAIAPVSEALAALAAICGGVVARRTAVPPESNP